LLQEVDLTIADGLEALLLVLDFIQEAFHLEQVLRVGHLSLFEQGTYFTGLSYRCLLSVVGFSHSLLEVGLLEGSGLKLLIF